VVRCSSLSSLLSSSCSQEYPFPFRDSLSLSLSLSLSAYSRISREHGELIRAASDKMEEHAEPVPAASLGGFGASGNARCGDDDGDDDDDEKSLAY